MKQKVITAIVIMLTAGVLLAVVRISALKEEIRGDYSSVDASVTSRTPEFAQIGAVPGPVDPLFLATGVSGTYTVPKGYVTGWSAIAGLDGGTVVITPTGPGIADAGAQPAVIIPAGYVFSLPRPVIAGQANEMGTGTIFVFNGTVAYTVVMSQGGT